MSNVALSLAFQQTDLCARLAEATEADLDHLDFGVIGIDEAAVVRLYNQAESRFAGLSPQRVLGHPLFTVVAPCMNNYMVAQRFEDAAAANEALDVSLDYVLTLRMRPVKVVLRLLADPQLPMRYVLVQRLA